ncbi:MAG: hypothetical protein ACLP5E_01970 [Streptosporangiaceae bacterium]
MSSVTRAAVYTVRIAAVTAAAPVLVGAAGSAATAELVGWELRQLASSPLSAEARRLKAEYRERGAARAGSAYTPGQYADSTTSRSGKARAQLAALNSSR